MNPYLDMPSVEDDHCETPGCKHDRAWQTGEGRWLCTDHADEYLAGRDRECVYDHAEYLREINLEAAE